MTKLSIFDLICLSWQLLYRFSVKKTLLLALFVVLISISELTSLIFVYPLLKFVINPNDEINIAFLSYLPVSVPTSLALYLLLFTSLFFIFASSLLRIIGINLFSRFSFQVASNISSWRFDNLTESFDENSIAMHSASKVLQEVKEFPIKLPLVLILPSIQIPQASLSLMMILTYTITTSFYSSIFILLFITLSYVIVYSIIKPKLYLYGENINISSKRITKIINNFSIGWKEIFAYNLASKFKNITSQSFSTNSFYHYKTYSLSGTPKIALESLILASVLTCAFTAIIFKVDIIAGLALVAFAFLKALPYMQTLFGAFSCLVNNLNLVETLHLKDYLRSTPSYIQKDDYFPTSSISRLRLNVKTSQINLSINLPKNSKIKSNSPLQDSISSGIYQSDVDTKFAIIGPSGSGKTLLLDYIAGVRNRHYQIIPPRNKNQFAAYSTQTPMIAPFSLLENITLSERHDSSIDETKLKLILDFLDLNRLFERYRDVQFSETHDLSGGEAQRVSIARSLYSTAPVLILDEPTSPLHPELAKKILKGLPNFLHNRIVFITLHSNKIPEWIDAVIELY